MILEIYDLSLLVDYLSELLYIKTNLMSKNNSISIKFAVGDNSSTSAFKFFKAAFSLTSQFSETEQQYGK